MPLYFAYGSNMHREQMSQRCPGAQALGLAKLRNWRFIITSDGVASILHQPGKIVHGVLWELTLAHVRVLDRYEGVARGWYEKVHLPVQRQGGGARALIYVGTNKKEGRPIPQYHSDIVLPAARDWSLPLNYLTELEAWSRR